MRTVAAFDAKTHFSKLLDLVEAGEKIQITRHGKPVARLAPEKKGISKADAERLVKALDEIRSRSRRGGPLKDLVNEGRHS